MWIHLLTLGLIDGAGGEPQEVQRNSAGFARLDSGHYKYKYKIEDEAVEIIEKAAVQRVNDQKLETLKSVFQRSGIDYYEVYKQVFIEVVAKLRAEKYEQDLEDEQIAMIMAAMI